jgi:hypothetical protein
MIDDENEEDVLDTDEPEDDELEDGIEVEEDEAI